MIYSVDCTLYDSMVRWDRGELYEVQRELVKQLLISS